VIPVLTAEEMRRADRHTIEQVGLLGAVLMENAGAAVARAIEERYPAARRMVVLCGKGNNGGDGFVVARRLRGRGAEALLLGRRDEVEGDARVHLLACERSGGRVTEVADGAAWANTRPRLASADLVVDALLGTGLRSRPTGLVAEAIGELIRIAGSGVPIVAVDIPSGVSSDGGGVEWPTARATLTVTFAAPKRGHVLPPACDGVGELVVADIGITRETLLAAQPGLFLLEPSDAAAAFPPRPAGAHKGDYGHVLIVAGSVGKTGAAVLAAAGALRAGAGLATVATAAPALPLVAAGRPEVMTEPLPATDGGGVSEQALERLLELAQERDAVVLGPGLGHDPSTCALVRAFVPRCRVPLLVDADGLNALGPKGEAAHREAPTVLTPHPGEMGRLLGRTAAQVQADRLRAALDLARATGALTVLKGHRTLVAEPSGRAAVNPTGNPGLASGGTGDVLAGVAGALLARHPPWLAATAAAYVHGLAGDCAARRRGQESLLAGDLLESLPEAIGLLPTSGGPASAR